MNSRAGPPLPSLIGREAEFGRLRQALDDASESHGSSWFVLGEPGAGKTRLAHELLDHARARGMPVVSAGASGVVPPPAYGVVAQALRSQVRTAPPSGGPLEPFAAGLAAVLPEWSRSAHDAQLTADQRRLLAAEGTFQLLLEFERARGRQQRTRGIAVCFDDLQWADPESVEVVHHLVAASHDSPLLVVCAVRSGEHSAAEAFARRLAQRGAAKQLELAPLSAEHLGALISRILGASPPERLVADVAHRSAGLPLFVEEIVDAYLASGLLAVRDGGVVWSGPAPGLVAPSMMSWVEARLARLSDHARAVVAAAAILDRFDRVLVDGAGFAPAAVETALNSAVDAGLLDRAAAGLRFHHDLTRDAVVRLLPPFRAEGLHRRGAEVLARHNAAPEERARHVEAVGERGPAAVLLVEAARRSLKAHALASAEDLAARAVRLAPDANTAAEARNLLAASLAEQGRWAEALEHDRALVAAGTADPTVVGRMADTAARRPV